MPEKFFGGKCETGIVQYKSVRKAGQGKRHHSENPVGSHFIIIKVIHTDAIMPTRYPIAMKWPPKRSFTPNRNDCQYKMNNPRISNRLELECDYH